MQILAIKGLIGRIVREGLLRRPLGNSVRIGELEASEKRPREGTKVTLHKKLTTWEPIPKEEWRTRHPTIKPSRTGDAHTFQPKGCVGTRPERMNCYSAIVMNRIRVSNLPPAVS